MGLDLSFLDDESVTDNLEDALAKKIINWLEHLATENSPHFKNALKFVKYFNQMIDSSEKTNTEKLYFEAFEILIKVCDPANKVVVTWVNFIYKGDEHETKRI